MENKITTIEITENELNYLINDLITYCFQLKEKGLDEKYYIVDKTAYGGSVTRLGRYAIYNNGQSPKEKSQYFGSFDEMKAIIDTLV